MLWTWTHAWTLSHHLMKALLDAIRLNKHQFLFELICIYIYIYVCVCVCVFIYSMLPCVLRVTLNLFVKWLLHIYIYIYIYMCVCIYIYIYMHVPCVWGMTVLYSGSYRESIKYAMFLKNNRNRSRKKQKQRALKDLGQYWTNFGRNTNSTRLIIIVCPVCWGCRIHRLTTP